MFQSLQKFGFFKYGKVIPGLVINGKPAPYPVLNERAVRAGAGMTFVLAFFSFFHALYLGNYFYLKIVVILFFVDFLMKAVIGTRFSPVGIVANWVVRKQKPEYIGAIQKRFAWSIGLTLATAMMLLLFLFDVRGMVNLAICLLCLTFMFFESAFGICVGCKIYTFLLAHGFITESQYKPACPGGVCAIDE